MLLQFLARYERWGAALSAGKKEWRKNDNSRVVFTAVSAAIYMAEALWCLGLYFY
jgi:hypothetical protein